MTETNTRIAELLGWKWDPSGWAFWWDGEHQDSEFDQDLNLTVREIERKGWSWSAGRLGRMSKASVTKPSPLRPMPDVAKADTPAEALALAFLAALKAEKEDG